MYNNLIIISVKGRRDDVVIREGGADDWAAYWLPKGTYSQSGSLVKVSRYDEMHDVLVKLVGELFPTLVHRP